MNQLIGAAAAALALCLYCLSRSFFKVEQGHLAVTTTFGRLNRKLLQPGLHSKLPWDQVHEFSVMEKVVELGGEDGAFPLMTEDGTLLKLEAKARLNPAVKLHEVSLQRDFRLYRDIHINDVNGTTVIVDLWVEFRVVDPEIALFEVENWEATLESAVAHAAMTVLSGKEFKQILAGGQAISGQILAPLAEASKQWGIAIERAHIRDVGLIPEVSAQLFDSVAAKLERAKALIEERGRLAIAELDAQTSQQIAELRGQAKSMYPLQLSPVFGKMARSSKIIGAYRKLHSLSRTQPSKTVYFDGFGADELRPVDAAMLWPQLGQSEERPN